MSRFLDTLSELERRYNELDHLMGDPAVATDPTRLMEYGRERAELDDVVTTFREHREIERQIREAELIATDDDRDLAQMASDELASLRPRRDESMARLKALLVPKDPNDDKNVIVEVRAGTGGDEAALF